MSRRARSACRYVADSSSVEGRASAVIASRGNTVPNASRVAVNASTLMPHIALVMHCSTKSRHSPLHASGQKMDVVEPDEAIALRAVDAKMRGTVHAGEQQRVGDTACAPRRRAPEPGRIVDALRRTSAHARRPDRC